MLIHLGSLASQPNGQSSLSRDRDFESTEYRTSHGSGEGSRADSDGPRRQLRPHGPRRRSRIRGWSADDASIPQSTSAPRASGASSRRSSILTAFSTTAWHRSTLGCSATRSNEEP